MRLLFAVLFLLNIAYHDTCVPIGSCPLVRLGQMGQMLRRNGNVFQMPPIKKNVGILPKQWGRVLTNPTVFLQKKLPQNGLHGRRRRGGGFPYFPFFYWERPLILRLLLQCNHTISLTYLNRWGTWLRRLWRLRSTLLRLQPLSMESLLPLPLPNTYQGLTTLQRIPTLSTNSWKRQKKSAQSENCCKIINPKIYWDPLLWFNLVILTL